jgi:hypothetical protein
MVEWKWKWRPTHLEQVLQERDAIRPFLDVVEGAKTFLDQLAESLEFRVRGIKILGCITAAQRSE